LQATPLSTRTGKTCSISGTSRGLASLSFDALQLFDSCFVSQICRVVVVVIQVMDSLLRRVASFSAQARRRLRCVLVSPTVVYSICSLPCLHMSTT
jgi:hypothetical protein